MLGCGWLITFQSLLMSDIIVGVLWLLILPCSSSAANEIGTLNDLRCLGPNDWKDLIPSVGPRNRIKEQVEKLCVSTQQASSNAKDGNVHA